ncbi:Calx-beta domain-containing protein [Spirulina sp. CS-785/01]|uniref:Calx-beta domain-containing protein n=1 Tax=Spirulina sp. CS-785/01 TaxID=3021716 RepID=UPI00232FE91A|nr:hypothetical protein [Spirulina sp. CS-785/01]
MLTDYLVMTIQFEQSSYRIQEGQTPAIRVTRTGDLNQEAFVQVRADYFGSASESDVIYETQTLEWGIGDGTPKEVRVETLVDELPEADEMLALKLWGVKGDDYGSPKETTILIAQRYQHLDPPEFQFSLHDAPVDPQGIAEIQMGQQQLYGLNLGSLRYFWGELQGSLAVQSGSQGYALKVKLPFENPLPLACPLWGGRSEVRGHQGTTLTDQTAINNTLRLVMEAKSPYIRLEYVPESPVYPVPLVVNENNYLVYLHFAGCLPRR